MGWSRHFTCSLTTSTTVWSGQGGGEDEMLLYIVLKAVSHATVSKLTSRRTKAGESAEALALHDAPLLC
eukprot:scaffold1365_cov163-Ochromonas_danica.AAC.11